MKRKLIYLGIIAFFAIGILFAKNHKVDICHIPPGNPENAHTINVSKIAARVHVLLHGDSYGSCDEGGEPDTGTPPIPDDTE